MPFHSIQTEKKRALGREDAELLLYEIAASQSWLNVSHPVLLSTAFTLPCYTIFAAAVILPRPVSLALMSPHCPQHWCTTLTVALLLFHIHWFSWQLLCICAAWWVFLCLSKPSQFHISQNLMSKHLRISSNHGTKSLLISAPPENCILFTASCSWPLSHLLPPSITIPCGMLK